MQAGGGNLQRKRYKGNDWNWEGTVSETIRACAELQDSRLLLESINVCASRNPGSKIHKAVGAIIDIFPFGVIEPG